MRADKATYQAVALPPALAALDGKDAANLPGGPRNKPATALPATAALRQFWPAWVAKRSAERFPERQSKPLVGCAKCMVRRWRSCKLHCLCILTAARLNAGMTVRLFWARRRLLRARTVRIVDAARSGLCSFLRTRHSSRARRSGAGLVSGNGRGPTAFH
jgi:hypothetical protein